MTHYEPQPGDIGLVAISGAGGVAIRFGQWLAGDGWTDYQHVFTYVGDGKIVEAMPGGARMVDLSYRYGDPLKIKYLRCPPQYGEDVAQKAISLLGVPYSAADYVAIGLHRFHIPAPHLREYIQNSRHLICSQLADRAAKLGGWQIFNDQRWEGYVTPNDLGKVYKLQQQAGHPIERAKVSR
jgi:hypothetical protein